LNLDRTRTLSAPTLLFLAFVAAPNVSAQVASTGPGSDLGGTSWQLVKFQSSDEKVQIPDDKGKYTIAFMADGRVSVRIDCNRGSGTWTSAGSNQLALGPLTRTRETCPPGSLHDLIVKHWPFVRSYVIKEGHLFLSLMADGGTYEFEPATSQKPVGASVQGTATYRERIAIPRNAVFEATLEDVSRAGAQAEVIARVRNEQPGNPTIPFVIAYDAGRINPTHSYSVRGRILVDGKVWFSTDQNSPVLTAGHDSVAQLLLKRMSASPSAAPLVNTYWKLTNLGTSAVTAASQQREPHFILHPATRSISGSGVCNQFTGGYRLKGDQISFSEIAATMMACVDGIDTEKRFLTAMGKVRRWRISGQSLELFDAAGALMARFEAVYMK
jgi:putative lipoprotein